MFKVDAKGSITLAAPAWGVLIVGVCLFGAWMTKMSTDVSKVHDIDAKVTKIELALAGAGITAKDDPWVPSKPSPPRAFSLLPSPSPVAVTKRE